MITVDVIFFNKLDLYINVIAKKGNRFESSVISQLSNTKNAALLIE